MEIVPVFHGKAGGGFLTRLYPKAGPVTYLGITQDADGRFRFVVSEGVIEAGPTLQNGDTTFRTRFSIGARVEQPLVRVRLHAPLRGAG